MSPKSRPFDEVATDVYANEGNALEPTTQHVVPLDVDDDNRECSLLRYFVGVHQDSAAFYKAASDSTRYPTLKPQLEDLAQLHTAVINSLGLRLRTKSLDPEKYAENMPDSTLVFGDIMHTLTTDHFPIRAAFTAEKKCIHMMEKAMEEDISPEAQAFFAEEIGALSRSEEILEAMQVLQER